MNSKVRILQSFNLKHKTPHSVLLCRLDKLSKKKFSKMYHKSKSIFSDTCEHPETHLSGAGWAQCSAATQVSPHR